MDNFQSYSWLINIICNAYPLLQDLVTNFYCGSFEKCKFLINQLSIAANLMLKKKYEISTKPYGLSRGETSPCCYDSEWSEITARGDHGATPCWYHWNLI